MSGCNLPVIAIRTTPGPITVRPLSKNAEAFTADIPDAQFAFIDDDSVEVLMVDGPPDDPQRVITLHVFWRPRGGLTPVDPNATNALMKYVDLREQEPVILSGAGFVFPRTKLNKDTISLDIWQMDLLPEDTNTDITHIDEPNPDLVIYRASGRVSAKRDDEGTRRQIELIKQNLIDAGI